MLVRVGEIGKPAFQLRPGEKGISVFDLEAVAPPLSEMEILVSFRDGSVAILIDPQILKLIGLQVVLVLGSDDLPQRLRNAHAEIRPGDEMTRKEFKSSLRELEEHVD